MNQRNLLTILGITAVLGAFEPGLAASATAQAAPVPVDASGERMVVQLVTPLSSELSQVGDSIQFRVVEPLTVGDRVLVGAGSTVEGVVTIAQPTGRVGGGGPGADRSRSRRPNHAVGDKESLSARLGQTVLPRPPKRARKRGSRCLYHDPGVRVNSAIGRRPAFDVVRKAGGTAGEK